MHKENKNNNFIQLFIFFLTVCPMFRRVPWDVVLLMQYCPERASKFNTEEKKLLNEVVEPLNRVDHFLNVLTTFLYLECGSSLAVYAESESSWISSQKS